MKRVIEYRKLFEISPQADLAELKSVYRNLMKVWHPDKFTEEAQKEEAEATSKKIIEAYHFLVSISPETNENNLEQYTETTSTSPIVDFEYKGQTLKIIFHDGSIYEYFGVPKNIYNKFIAASALPRFARRHIFYSFTYRNTSKQALVK